ncbi:unnamed protein product [Sphenostylis stenocarpa]|uniref:Uncharacterized protein n=1 Tax=Sphenostylis stenocarpa TaxID=92480 RepID=A0AA86T7E1_9FABA|nr:unnamed protein product [Sphenostylis stenocarpa]
MDGHDTKKWTLVTTFPSRGNPLLASSTFRTCSSPSLPISNHSPTRKSHLPPHHKSISPKSPHHCTRASWQPPPPPITQPSLTFHPILFPFPLSSPALPSSPSKSPSPISTMGRLPSLELRTQLKPPCIACSLALTLLPSSQSPPVPRCHCDS